MSKEEKVKYDFGQKCGCGKPMPIAPHYCEKCKKCSIKGLKVEIVDFGGKELPSGIKLK